MLAVLGRIILSWLLALRRRVVRPARALTHIVPLDALVGLVESLLILLCLLLGQPSFLVWALRRLNVTASLVHEPIIGCLARIITHCLVDGLLSPILLLLLLLFVCRLITALSVNTLGRPAQVGGRYLTPRQVV